MKMAKASQEDMDAAMTICGMLCDVFEYGTYPRGIDGEHVENEPYAFEEYKYDDLRALYDRIKAAMDSSPGGLFRVIFGMCACLMNEKNEVVDPDSDVLELHPRIIRALADAETLHKSDVHTPQAGDAQKQPEVTP